MPRRAASLLSILLAPLAVAGFNPGSRPMLSAHNCYPYHGMWADRIDRALETGFPIAIEQDLCWVESGDGSRRSVVAHNGPFDGTEPTLRDHFFERIRPIVEASLAAAQADPAERYRWPLIVLDLDVKDHNLDHHRDIDRQLREFRPWLTVAERQANITEASPLRPGPVMVLIGSDDSARRVFHDDVPVGDHLIAFGRAPLRGPDTRGLSDAEKAQARVTFPASSMVTAPADNFHRWQNHSWHTIEAGGAPMAGDWTEADERRLRELVGHAHAMGHFIRFYAVNGHAPADAAVGGYSPGYNTGSLDAARVRWRAMIDAGVDFIATDQYRRFHAARAGDAD